ncbi:RHS repeat domain-containing protein [Lysobacter fragariae]
MFSRKSLLHRLRSKAALLLLSVAALATVASTANSSQAPAGHSCEAQYDAASLIIATEIASNGDQHKLQTKLDNAWRAFWKDKLPAIANGNLDTLGQLLAGNPTKGVGAQSKTLVAEAVTDFRRCINGEVPVGTSTLAISVFRFDETTPDGKGAPAGEGVYVFVDGKHLALTDANGKATVTVPAGLVAVQAIVPSTSIAEASVQAAAGATVPLELVLDDSKEVTSPVQLSVSSVSENVLPAGFTSFTVTLLDGGAPRAAVSVAEVTLEDDIGNTLERLTDDFQVDALGRLEPVTLATVADAVARYPGRTLVLRVMAEDALGFTLLGTMPLYLGQHALNVTLVAPPSNPSLPVAGIQVTYRLMGSDLTVVRTSDAAGNLSFGPVPLGNANLDSVTLQSGRYYYGQASFFLTRSSLARVTMTHADDIANGVRRFELLPLFNAAGDAGNGTPTIDPVTAAQRSALHAAGGFADGNLSTLDTVNLRVGAGAADTQVSGSRTLTVAQGTQRVVLRYLVTTAEYPVYVRQQSIYNDTWSLSVHARQSGQQLFNTSRNVNSQLTQAPIWLANGSTGYIEETFDVAALTAQAPAELLLAATATNVADEFLPTIVDADLSDDPDRLIIKEVTAERLASTDGDHNSYSVPLQGENNTLARWFTLTIDKPDGAQVTRVRAELQHGSGTMGQIFEEGPGANVQVVNDTTLRVRVTYHAGGNINTVPPPAHAITYKFTVFANLQDGTEVSDDAISSAKRALWRLQAYWRDPTRRYGQRDSGGDDWLAARTWEFIDQHGALLTRIDDISGEHGRDIGHATHDVGTDIDLYHVYRFAGATSGEDNYNRLRNAVIRVLSQPADQTQADRAAITAWVSQTRPRFQTILSTTDAQTIYYAIGTAYTASGIALPQGWARGLLVNGTVSASGHAFDTGLGAWGFAQTQLTYNAIHNTHFHIKRPRER